MEIKYLNEDCEKISKSCDLEFGKDMPFLTDEVNLLLNNKPLNANGYEIFNLNNIKLFQQFNALLTAQVKQRLLLYQSVPESFALNKYHCFLEKEETHYKISTWALDYNILDGVYFELKEQIENILKLKLATKRIEHMGISGEYVGFRILRPMKNDHNPFHRDAWLPYWRDTVNVWLPLCGFEDGNSLQLIPQSHFWSDTEILKTKIGAVVDGKKYHVPAAIGTVNRFNIISPVLRQGQGLIFSPYLVHGNGVNRKLDETRVSIEFRFCRSNAS